MGKVGPCDTRKDNNNLRGGVKCPRVSSVGVLGWWEAGKGVGLEKLIEINTYK